MVVLASNFSHRTVDTLSSSLPLRLGSDTGGIIAMATFGENAATEAGLAGELFSCCVEVLWVRLQSMALRIRSTNTILNHPEEGSIRDHEKA